MERLSQRFSLWTIAVFAVVAIAGLIDLAQPLEGDQALFLIGANEMAHGAVLYRDFWDLKQPGIFDFYYLAGIIGGFNALAVHALELVYLLAFAFVLHYALSRSKTLAPAATIAPLFSIALYYIASASPEQLQVEALSGFPIFVCAWLSCEGTQRADRTRHVAFVLAGFAAGCALVFKLVFAPLVAALFVTALALPSGAYRPRATFVVAASVAFVAGAAIPMLATIATLAHGGALGIALDTWLSVPPRIVSTLPPQKIAILKEGLRWFSHAFGASIVLAIAGIVVVVRSGKADALARCTAVWIVVGAATILAQRTSWWEYQWLLESVPLGIFAAFAIVALARTPRAPAAIVVFAVAALLALLPARTEARKLVALAKYRLAIGANDRERYRADASLPYAGTAADASFLPPGADVYVMGNPMYYVATRRMQPLVLNGWSLELMLPDEREELLREFKAKPPAYVYASIDDDGRAALLARSPDFAAYFSHDYHPVAHGTFGVLYRYAPNG